MSQHILYCDKCEVYSMQEKCPVCDKKTLSRRPAKFSPQDKWGKYRRMAKKDE
ncbi:MAG: RNA-protein complex protein Nop10 [archaeon]